MTPQQNSPGMKRDEFEVIHETRKNAWRYRSMDELGSAYSEIAKGIQLLEKALRGPGVHNEQLFLELADLYGMQGGILRRLGKEEAALRSYEAGRVYSNLSTHGGFNLMNSAFLLWLRSDHSQHNPELLSKIEIATRVLEEAERSTRDRTPWTLADLGTLYLIGEQHEAAITCFHRCREMASAFPLDAIRGTIAKIWAVAMPFDPRLATVAKNIFVILGGREEDLKLSYYFSCFISYSHADDDFANHLYTDLEKNGVSCWFAPHNIAGGKKIHEQIEEAIRRYDRLLLILSEHSMGSDWVATEIANARAREANEKRQVLFPISLVDHERIHAWRCFDADRGKDSAKEIREYFIPDFTNWKDRDAYKKRFERLLMDLKKQAPRIDLY